MLELELLQVALGNRTKLSRIPTQEAWNRIYQFAKKQALIGVMFCGIEKLSKDQRPQLNLLMLWYGQTEFVKKQNQLLNKRSSEITEMLAKDGFRSCILKGQANAYYYPQPELRIPGDVDIWVEGGHRKIVRYVKEHTEVERVQFHHVDYRVFDDVEVEVHFKPMLLFNHHADKHLQQVFQSYADKCFQNWVETREGFCFCVLTNRSNILVQLIHMYRHMLCGSIGLRQVVDFYYLLRYIHIHEKKLLTSYDIKNYCCPLKVKYDQNLLANIDYMGFLAMFSMISGIQAPIFCMFIWLSAKRGK